MDKIVVSDMLFSFVMKEVSLAKEKIDNLFYDCSITTNRGGAKIRTYYIAIKDKNGKNTIFYAI